MHLYEAPTLTLLHDHLCDQIINASEKELDVVSAVDVQFHNVIAQADSMEWDFDLKNLWLTPQRWSMMSKQYIDPVRFQEWLTMCTRHLGTKHRGIALMRTNEVKARGGPAQGNKETRRWGSCMLALSYKAIPEPQITLYSRTSYLGYLSGLDLSVAWMCGYYLAGELGCKVEDFKFVWMNEAMQFHNFKSLAYMLNHEDPKRRKRYRTWLTASDEKLEKKGRMEEVLERPAVKLSRVWMQRLMKMDRDNLTLGDMTYNTYRRIRRRYHTEVLGYEEACKYEGWSHYKMGPQAGEQKEFFKAYKPLASVTIHSLDFKRLGLPYNPGGYGEILEDIEPDLEEEDDD
jgi:hypothetical protein